ncbi:MAG: glycosyltransferase family 4 protein [Anaerolineae bacterium]
MQVYVIEGSGRGGMIQYDYNLCRALKLNGVDAALVTSTYYELRDLPHNFPVYELLHLWDPRAPRPLSRWRWMLRRAGRGIQYPREWLRLILFLLRQRPDVVLFGEIRFNFEFYFFWLLKRLGFKLAAVVHDVRTWNRSSSGALTDDSQEHLQAYLRIYRLFDALFVHDRSNTELFLSLYPVEKARVHEIQHATSDLTLEVVPTITADEARVKMNVPPGKKVALFFGALAKYKGVDVLVEAFAQTIARCPDAHLVIAGFPTKEMNMDELRARAAELGIADAVSWYLDYVPNEWIKPLMEISTVVVLPYRLVGQSGVLQQAYAHGRPTIATRVGGLPDAIEDGESGLLVPPEDPAALAEAMVKVLNDPAFADRIAARGKELSQTRFSSSAVAASIENVLKAL